MPHIAPWFPDAKLGIFIHWVLKACPSWPSPEPPASERRAAAREAAKEFTAAKFDARQWARMFKSWGAKYVVLTTKHHIGFALFDCPGSPFTAKNDSPAGRDLIAEYVEALREEGLKVGLYYSLPDWSHPDYPSLTGGDDPCKYSKEDDPARWQKFLDHMFAEVRHLCTAYGKIDLLWFDGDWERSAEQWKTVELAHMIEELQPHIVMNNRLRHKALGHYGSPESNAPLGPRGEANWEFCFTPGENWDGKRANINVKPGHELTRIFGDMIGMGGNVLMNVAPDNEGFIPPAQTEPISAMGRWVNEHAEAIYGTEAGLPAGLFNGSSTRRGSVLYLIAYDKPQPELVVKGLQGEVESVTLLKSGKPLDYRASGGRAKFGLAGWLFINLPEEDCDPIATVVKITFKGDVVEVTKPAGGKETWRGRPVFDEQTVGDAR